MKGQKTGIVGVICFITLFALVVVLKLVEAERSVAISLSVGEVVKLFLLGALASSTMVIPGVSGSMLLKTLGYYEPIVTGAIPGAVSALGSGDWSLLLNNVGILLPFGLGIVVGIFAIAKFIEVMLSRWKGITYCAILGMVAASPVVILMEKSLYAGFNLTIGLVSALMLALGTLIALKLGGSEA